MTAPLSTDGSAMHRLDYLTRSWSERTNGSSYKWSRR